MASTRLRFLHFARVFAFVVEFLRPIPTVADVDEFAFGHRDQRAPWAGDRP